MTKARPQLYNCIERSAGPGVRRRDSRRRPLHCFILMCTTMKSERPTCMARGEAGCAQTITGLPSRWTRRHPFAWFFSEFKIAKRGEVMTRSSPPDQSATRTVHLYCARRLTWRSAHGLTTPPPPLLHFASALPLSMRHWPLYRSASGARR